MKLFGRRWITKYIKNFIVNFWKVTSHSCQLLGLWKFQMSQVTYIDEWLWTPKSGDGIVSSDLEKFDFSFLQPKWLWKLVQNSEFHFQKVTSSENSEIHIYWKSISLLSFPKISCLNFMKMERCDFTNLPFFIHFCTSQPNWYARFFDNVRFLSIIVGGYGLIRGLIPTLS